MVAPGGPFEGFCYAQEWGPLWYFEVLPILMLTHVYCTHPGILLNTEHLADLREIMERLTGHDGPPWWRVMKEIVG